MSAISRRLQWWVPSFRHKHSDGARRTSSGVRRLGLEPLERRTLLDASAGQAPADILLGDNVIQEQSPDGMLLGDELPSLDFAFQIGSSGLDAARSVATDAAGNVYVMGALDGTADFDPGPGTVLRSGNRFVAKYTSGGALLWAKTLTGYFDLEGGTLAVSGSDVYVACNFSGTVDFDPGPGEALQTADGANVFVLKLDGAGNYLWARKLGGSGYASAQGIAADDSGNVTITGYFSDAVDFDPGEGASPGVSAGNWDIFVWKLDAAGNLLWGRSMGSTGNDIGHGIALDDMGNVHVVGSFFDTVDFNPGAGVAALTSAGWDDAFVLKLDQNGTYLWAKQLGGGPTEMATAIAVDPVGNIYTAGYFWGDGDFDPGPGTKTLASAGEEDIFVVRLDPSGNFVWAHRMGGPESDRPAAIALGTNQEVFTTGLFRGTAQFDPQAGAGAGLMTSSGQDDLFLSALYSSGEFLWAGRMGGTGVDQGLGIAIDASENIYAAGFFTGTADVDPNAQTFNLTSNGDSDALLVKLRTQPAAEQFIVGDRVWHDLNENGLQDDGEPGVADVRVELYDAGTDGQMGGGDDLFLADTTTGPLGEYRFENLSAGTYYLRFGNLPAGRSFTVKDAGNDSADSDADPANGLTDLFVLAGDEVTRDAGLVGQTTSSTDTMPGYLGLALVDVDGSAFRADFTQSGLQLTWLGDILGVEPLYDVAGSALQGSRFYGISDAGDLDPSLRSVLGYADVDISAAAAGGTIPATILGAVFVQNGSTLVPVELNALEFGVDQTTLFAAGTAGGNGYIFQLDYQNPQDYGMGIEVVLATPRVNLGGYRSAGDLAFVLDGDSPDPNNLYLTTNGSGGQPLSLLAAQPASGSYAAVPGVNLGRNDFEGLTPWFAPGSLIGFRYGDNEAVEIDLDAVGGPQLQSLGFLSDTHLSHITGASALWMEPEELGTITTAQQNDPARFGQYWYDFVAGASGTLTVQAQSGQELTLYAYGEGGHFQMLADGVGTVASQVDSGQQLYLHVGGLSGNADVSFTIGNPATDLNTVDYWNSGEVIPADGQLAYQFQAAHNGILTVELRQGASAMTEMALYVLDATGNPVQPPQVAQPRIDFAQATAGSRYRLTITGLTSPAEVVLANLVEHSGGSVAVHGTQGDDNFVFDASSGSTITIKDVEYSFSPAAASTFSFDGLGGSDDVHFIGSPGADTATLRPTWGAMTGQGYSLEVANIESIDYDGGPGDTVTIWGSKGTNTYLAKPGSGEMTGDGVSIFVTAESIYGRGNGGGDTVLFEDSDGDDVLEFFPIWARMRGDGYFQHVRGFKTMKADAELGENGTDRVVVRGSVLNDYLKVNPYNAHGQTVARFLSGSGSIWHIATGFEVIVGYGRGGGVIDQLVLNDTPAADTFELSRQKADLLEGADYGVTVATQGFGTVELTRTNLNTSADKVNLGDSQNPDHDDTLMGNPQQVTMSGPGYSNLVVDFPLVMAYSSGNGHDIAYFSDLADPNDSRTGVDTFTGRPLFSQLEGPGYRLYARLFDEVHAESKYGRDVANLNGNSNADEITATATEVRHSGTGVAGPFDLYARSFNEINAFAGDGQDKAVLTDATIEADYQPPAGTSLDELSQVLWLNLFEKIERRESSTGELTQEIDGVNTVFAYWE